MNAAPVEHRGLTAEEVRTRIESGQVNDVRQRTSRSTLHIIRSNVLTWFNLVLGTLLVLMLVFASWRDALFGLLLVLNTAIGIVQELRAKHTLDRLSLISAPKVQVIRHDGAMGIRASDVVVDDLIVFEPGDQMVVDSTIIESAGLEVDESSLTGEAVPVAKSIGESVLSGSFVVAGRGLGTAVAVGSDAYARRIEAQGRRYTRVSSDIMSSIDRVLRAIGIMIVPVGALAVWHGAGGPGTVETKVTNAVAPLVAMVPEGLVLLSSIAFAVAAIRLAEQHVLVNELPAVEGLARTDVLCADKTGTLTEPRPVLAGIEAAAQTRIPESQARDAIGALAWADPAPNATTIAIRDGMPAPAGWSPRDAVPFSSGRKWSAADFGDHGVWVIGAPDVVLPRIPTSSGLQLRASELSSRGMRVLVLARAERLADKELPPEGLAAAALIWLAESVRSDAAQTVRYLSGQGVEIKIVSGDDPQTVAMIAARAGVPHADRAIDARTLSEPAALAQAMEGEFVFGRVMPEQKAEMVAALQRAGHVVAMTGDGVNDVLAVKQADLGIAMGSGVAATKAVAQIVLLDSRFAHVPAIVREGRRVTANAERVANLFITKTCWALLIAVAVVALDVPYPFLPRQLTLAGSLTIGVPAFFLALSSNERRYRPGLLRRVLRFTVPAGVITAVAILGVFAGALEWGFSLGMARTLSTVTLGFVSFGVIAVLEWPLTGWRLAIVAGMAAAMGVTFTLPFARDFLALGLPSAAGFGACALASGITVGAIALVRRSLYRVGRRP